VTGSAFASAVAGSPDSQPEIINNADTAAVKKNPKRNMVSLPPSNAPSLDTPTGFRAVNLCGKVEGDCT
jgi:hypothetical protein